MKRAVFLGMVVGVLVGVSCLPGDIRPEPGRIYVTAEPSAASLDGFTTEDGWAIHFERLLVGLGPTTLGGSSCDLYGESRYSRLFDFGVSAKQKLADLYARDECDLQFRFAVPWRETYLEKGVSEADREFMGTWIKNWYKRNRTSVYLRGTASKGSVTKSFEWKFVSGYTLGDCTNIADGTMSTHFHLQGGDDMRPVITFHAEDLFRAGIEKDAPRSFDDLAAADTNEDGKITLKEIAEIPSPVMEWSIEMYKDAGLPDGDVLIDDGSKLHGWARFMRQKLLPSMFYVDGNPCQSVFPEPASSDGEFSIDF